MSLVFAVLNWVKDKEHFARQNTPCIPCVAQQGSSGRRYVSLSARHSTIPALMFTTSLQNAQCLDKVLSIKFKNSFCAFFGFVRDNFVYEIPREMYFLAASHFLVNHRFSWLSSAMHPLRLSDDAVVLPTVHLSCGEIINHKSMESDRKKYVARTILSLCSFWHVQYRDSREVI